MSLRIIRCENYRETPWKNGGGVTHEIARSDQSAEPEWRVSLATIDRDGPFSDFAGYDRTIVPVEGAGFELTLDDGQRAVLDRLYEPFRFSGEKKVWCRLLEGPSRDLNAMTLRSLWLHDVTALVLSSKVLAFDCTGSSLLYFSGDAQVRHDGEVLVLQAGDSLACDEPVRLALEARAPDARVLAIRITPRA